MLVGTDIVLSHGIAVHGINHAGEAAGSGYAGAARNRAEICILPYVARQKQFMQVLVNTNVGRPDAIILRVEKACERASIDRITTSCDCDKICILPLAAV